MTAPVLDPPALGFSVLGSVVSRAPRPGRRITAVRLDGSRSLDQEAFYAASGRLARWLLDLGVRAGDRIGVLAGNGLEWALIDLAALRIKAVTAGLDPAKFAPGDELAARYGLKLLFTDRAAEHTAAVLPLDEASRLIDEAMAAEAGGYPLPQPELPQASYAPGDVVTLKFTSGSTGEPKGLAATAGSMDATMAAVQELFRHGPQDDVFLFLPLSLAQQRYWIYSALCFGFDLTVSTYEAAFPALARVQPTVVMGVPGFYETAMKHLEARAARAAARALFGRRIRYLWTGSAPARPAMLAFFEAAGLPIYEGYGLNETCIVAKNHPGAHREGSVGRVLPGKKVLFDQDGRISVACDYPVNTRYEYAGPGESERMFGPDGTVRTGDVGHLDEDGFLFIHGRSDDVIVLDNGRKVAVRPLEEFFKGEPAVGECVVFCPTQTHLAAVVSPASPQADQAAIARRLAQANAAFGADEQIGRLVVADEPFSVANGLLGTQFKPQRSRIFELYRDRLV
jgi:long-chain acyl-CoA synthetase